MEDFTVGVTEKHELNQVPPNLYRIMLKAYERSSLMSSSIDSDPNILKAQTPECLIKGHTYSVIKEKYVDIQIARMSGKIPLIRIRSPWGNEAEWIGQWTEMPLSCELFQLRRRKRLASHLMRMASSGCNTSTSRHISHD
jgi:calpain